MRASTRFTILLTLLVLVAAACDWSMVGFNAGRSGFNLFEKKITPANIGGLTETWYAALGSGTSAPVVGNGRLFVTTGRSADAIGGLQAYDAAGTTCTGAAPATCSPIWSKMFALPASTETAFGAISPPLLTDSYVAVDTALVDYSYFYLPGRQPLQYVSNLRYAGGSFDPASGAPVAGQTRTGIAPAAEVDGAVYGYRRTTHDLLFLGYNLRYDVTYLIASVPGDQGSSFSIRNQPVGAFATFVGSAPAVSAGALFVMRPGELQAYDARGRDHCATVAVDADNECLPMWTGTLRHPATFDGMPAVAKGRVYAPALDGAVEVFDTAGCGAAACESLWTAQAGSSHLGPVSVTDDTLFAASDDGHLYAFDATGCGVATCEPKWSSDLGSPVHAPSVAGSVLFTGSEDGHLYAFIAAGCDRPTCTPVWTGNVGAPIHTAPVISDGRVFVTDASGTLHAFGLTP